jgi:hypothetical protein
VGRPAGHEPHHYATELNLGPSAAYAWLEATCGRFGFIRRYVWEPWHYELSLAPYRTQAPRGVARLVVGVLLRRSLPPASGWSGSWRAAAIPTRGGSNRGPESPRRTRPGSATRGRNPGGVTAVLAGIITDQRMGGMESAPGMELGSLGFYVTVWS